MKWKRHFLETTHLLIESTKVQQNLTNKMIYHGNKTTLWNIVFNLNFLLDKFSLAVPVNN